MGTHRPPKDHHHFPLILMLLYINVNIVDIIDRLVIVFKVR